MPEPDLTSHCSCRQQVSMWAKRHTKNTSESICKHRCCQVGIGKIDLRQIHSLEIGLPHHQTREIVSTKRTSHLNEQIEHVACYIRGIVVTFCTQGSKEAL